MAEIFYDDDADLSIIQGRKVAVLGYGSQGHAHALSLRDSGVDVRVGLPEGSKSRSEAEAEGLRVVTPARPARRPTSSWCWRRTRSSASSTRRPSSPTSSTATRSSSATASTSATACIQPPAGVDVCMVAPKGPGHLVRRQFVDGRGVPVPGRGRAGRDRQRAGTWRCPTPRAIGGTRAGAIKTTFTEETETDLFGEQAVLCGGLSELVKAGFETLIEAGYQPEVAYFECLHELKLIVDLMYEGGISKMYWSVSDTAEYGDYTRGPRLVTDATKAEMQQDPRRDHRRVVRPGVDGGVRRRADQLQALLPGEHRAPGRADRRASCGR